MCSQDWTPSASARATAAPRGPSSSTSRTTKPCFTMPPASTSRCRGGRRTFETAGPRRSCRPRRESTSSSYRPLSGCRSGSSAWGRGRTRSSGPRRARAWPGLARRARQPDKRTPAADSLARMIVVVGESLVDLVPQDGERLRAHLGGGPFNTARALGRLRRPVSFLGAMSTDPLGARLLSALIADGVSIDTVVDTDAPTTLALASIGESGSASYNFYVADTAASRLTPDQAVDALPDDLDAVCAGSLGLVLEPIAAAVTAVVEAS